MTSLISSLRTRSTLHSLRGAVATTASFSSNKAAQKNVVLVDGVRLPFTMGNTVYKDYLAVDLQRMALKGLLVKTALDPNEIDQIICGTVIQECKTSNIAREAALGANIPISVPAATVTLACISSNLAITTAAEKIISGNADVIIAGGCETFSDVPIRFSKKTRAKLLTLQKAMKGGVIGGLKHMFGGKNGLSLKDLLTPELPAIANYTTGEVMGHSSDRLASKFGVSRADQDEYTVRSHTRAAKAHADGLYDGEVIPVNGSTEENGIKGDSTIDKVGKLKPAFVKPHGTHTADRKSVV